MFNGTAADLHGVLFIFLCPVLVSYFFVMGKSNRWLNLEYRAIFCEKYESFLITNINFNLKVWKNCYYFYHRIIR